MTSPLLVRLFMHFPRRLAEIRRQRGLTQQQLAEQAGVHVSQYKRYEAGSSQPTIEVFQRIVLALHVSADALLFDPDERDPKDERLRLQFEALGRLDPDERAAVQTMIDGVLPMHDARRYTQRPSG